MLGACMFEIRDFQLYFCQKAVPLREPLLLGRILMRENHMAMLFSVHFIV